MAGLWLVKIPYHASSNAKQSAGWFLEFPAYEIPGTEQERMMTTQVRVRDRSSDRLLGAFGKRLKPSNIWVETARAALETARDAGDEATTEACQRVIDADSAAELPGQSDLNIILGFMDAHTH
jgi:hypothetical protein